MTDQSCKNAIDDHFKYGSNTMINGNYVFKYTPQCRDLDHFKKVFNENYKNKYSYTSSDATYCGNIISLVGSLIIKIGSILETHGNNISKDSVIIKKIK